MRSQSSRQAVISMNSLQIPVEGEQPGPSPNIPGDNALVLVDISKAFEGLLALSHVSITLDQRCIVSLIGPNGSGKTTLLNVVNGLLKPTSGQIWFHGNRIDGLKAHERVKLGIARAFQSPRVFAQLTVLENVLVGSHTASAGGVRSFFATRRSERSSLHREARQVLEFVGIPRSKEQVRVRALALREQRAVELGRALMMKPKLLLLDEPTSGMDPSEIPPWIAYMHEVQRELELTMLLVEHSMKVVSEISDRVFVLSGGNLLAHGTADEVLSDPSVRDVYIGHR